MRELLIVLQKAMAASACVFFAAGAVRHVVHVMAEEAAHVPDLLGERPARIRVFIDPEQQRMPASHTDILTMAVAFREQIVGVDAQETRQGVPHSRNGAAPQDWLVAPDALVPRFEKGAVVNTMSEEAAAQAIQRVGVSRAVELERSCMTHIC